MAQSAGYLIYAGVMPLIKMYIGFFLGFVLSKKGMFTPAASRGLSQVTLNVGLPCLIFSSIIPSFNSSNISAMGPLALLAIVYQALGFISGLIIRELCYVPRNFWQGILVACGLSNWGNLPTAVVVTLMAQPPFDPSTDVELGISFISIFILVNNITFWVIGAARSLAWDYLPGVPQGEAALVRVPWYEKPIGRLIARYLMRKDVGGTAAHKKEADVSAVEKGVMEGSDVLRGAASLDVAPVSRTEEAFAINGDEDPEVQLARRSSRLSSSAVSARGRRPSIATMHRPRTPPGAPPPSLVSRSATSLVNAANGRKMSTGKSDTSTSSASVAESHIPTFRERLIGHVTRTLHYAEAIFHPTVITIAISLPCALVPDLKALFVNSDSKPSWRGPDGNPPLFFILDTASLFGNLVVPSGLILLGGSFARIRFPRPLSKLPIPAMIASTAIKLIAIPALGVLIVQGMVGGGMVPANAKAERFVATFLGGTPALVNQLMVTALYAGPDADLDTVSAFLLVQYSFMFISSAILTAVSLLLLG
ncbi:auxin efflux carrier [Schizophyllum amplum]|uniref:Auxin efflux carrier n=1 Tax=Schizophyllum amplum TaxID=97359 RepID=A0A550BSI8_9AGAR|nr:auxin efflux carrier [Auriculariopsis ampla]